MPSGAKIAKTLPLLGFALSLVLFSCGFFLAYHQDAREAEKFSHIAFSHFSQSRLARDDMGLIDWARDLEYSEGVLAFKAAQGGKILAKGGNQNFIPFSSIPGTRFVLPSTWITRLGSENDSQGRETFDLALALWPGPLLWGLFGLGAAWTMGAFVFWGLSRAAGPMEEMKTQEPPVWAREFENPLPTPSAESLFLFLDSNCVVRNASPTATKLFGEKHPALMGLHLLDLKPHPSVIKAIGEKSPQELKNAFPAFPSIVLTLEVLPEGFMFVIKENPKP